MPDADRLTPADPKDIADTLAFALCRSGRKRVHDADEYMARTPSGSSRRSTAPASS